MGRLELVLVCVYRYCGKELWIALGDSLLNKPVSENNERTKEIPNALYNHKQLHLFIFPNRALCNITHVWSASSSCHSHQHVYIRRNVYCCLNAELFHLCYTTSPTRLS